MTRPGIVVFACLAFWGIEGSAQTVGDVFALANEHYREGRFREAVEAYQSVLEQGWMSAPLYFNLGNCHYRLGNVAEAILAYERAQRIDPSDPDIRFNLSLANLRTVDRIDTVPELFVVTWVRSLAVFFPLEITKGILAGSWLAFFGILTILNITPGISRERSLRVAAAICLAGTVLAGALFFLQVFQTSDESAAIIVSNVVTAKASPDDQSVDSFVIHEGLKVRMEDAVGDWVRISLADGKVGWIPSASCEAI